MRSTPTTRLATLAPPTDGAHGRRSLLGLALTLWRLRGGGTAGNSSALKARARCATPPDGDAGSLVGGTWWFAGSAPSSLRVTSGTVCVLFHVFGALQHATSFVTVVKGEPSWMPFGGNLGAGAGAASKCYS
jgi:hypothetical protein